MNILEWIAVKLELSTTGTLFTESDRSYARDDLTGKIFWCWHINQAIGKVTVKRGKWGIVEIRAIALISKH